MLIGHSGEVELYGVVRVEGKRCGVHTPEGFVAFADALLPLALQNVRVLTYTDSLSPRQCVGRLDSNHGDRWEQPYVYDVVGRCEPPDWERMFRFNGVDGREAHYVFTAMPEDGVYALRGNFVNIDSGWVLRTREHSVVHDGPLPHQGWGGEQIHLNVVTACGRRFYAERAQTAHDWRGDLRPLFPHSALGGLLELGPGDVHGKPATMVVSRERVA